MNELIALRNKLQSFCYWWKVDHRWGACQERNGMDHVCAFCELTADFDRVLKQQEKDKK